MRYPGEENKSDSINISSAGDSALLGGFSSSSTSASSSQEQNDPNDDGGANIATISEHVLFGNNNGQNRFLYLYYSESSTGDNSRRPYTTGGGIDSFKSINTKKMGSDSQQQPSWNDLSSNGMKRSSGRGSAGPSPISYGMNDGDEYDFDGKMMQMSGVSRNSAVVKNDATPYPVYLSPVEGSPIMMPSSPKNLTKPEKEAGGRDRMDSITGELFDDEEDWERIYSVPDVDSRYLFSPDPTTTRKSISRGSREGSSRPQIKKSSSSLNVQKPSPITSASSMKNLKAQGSHSRAGSRRVRVTPQASSKGGQRKGGIASTKQWSSTSSIHSKKRSPMASSTPSSKSLGKGNHVNQHGVTHHHHQPPTGNGSNDHHNSAKRVSCATTGDGLDQMIFRNGIGAFFGTPASKKISQNHEPTPEEMYRRELEGWKSRLTTSATIFAATLFILSCASLLFVFPILVDPILVGFEAQFSDEPVSCRTTNFRNGSGSSECAIPSCREGCTLDLFSCIFVEVEYSVAADNLISQITPSPSNNSANNNSINFSNVTNNSSISLLSPSHPEVDSQKRSAILLINVNGCGYPPDVSCSDFERKFAPIHTEFPCYYSQRNASIVVPHYSRHTEIIHLTLAVCVPVGVALFSGISLYLLVRYNAALKTSIYKKYAARKKAQRAKRQKLKEQHKEEEDVDVEEDVTSISELEPLEDYEHKENKKAMQNGNSRIGNESSSMLTSTQM